MVTTEVSLFLFLAVPGFLGVSAIVTPATDGVNVASVLISLFGGLTVLIAALAVATLFASGPGGVFLGAVLVLFIGAALGITILAWNMFSIVGRRVLAERGETV